MRSLHVIKTIWLWLIGKEMTKRSVNLAGKCSQHSSAAVTVNTHQNSPQKSIDLSSYGGKKVQLKWTTEGRGGANRKAFARPGYLITADVCMVMPANYPKRLSSSLCCNKTGGCLRRCERGRFNYLNLIPSHSQQCSGFGWVGHD